MVGGVEERGSADETQQKHADIQIAIEERQLVLDHITRRQYLHSYYSLPYKSKHRCFYFSPLSSIDIL